MSKKNGFKTAYLISFALQLGFLIAVPIIVFMLIGYWLDKKAGTLPLFLLISMAIAIAVTVHEVHEMLKTVIDDTNKHQ